MDTITIKFLNSNGGGFAEEIQVPANYTVGQLLQNKMGAGFNAGNHFVRVNRNLATTNQVLNDGDSVTVTPAKIQGAAA